MSLGGRRVLILGGTSGMGLATAHAVREAGADVAIVGRDPEKAEAARRAVGEGAVCGVLDARDTGALAAFAESLDAVDHVVSFTGDQPAARLGRGRPRDVHVGLRRPGLGRPQRLRSGGSKDAAGRLVRLLLGSLCAETEAGALGRGGGHRRPRVLLPGHGRRARPGCGVNAICPGAFDTEVLRRALNSQAALDRVAAAVPLGRIGQPAEIAHAVMFLLTNTYTTGTTLRVDGGLALT